MKASLIFVLALVALASAETSTDPTDSSTGTTTPTTTQTTTTPTTTQTTTTPTTTQTTTTPTTTETTTTPTTTATSATTTATSATTTPTTASTASTTTRKPATLAVQPQVVAIFKVELTTVNGQVTHTATQVCSGTIVSSRSVLTTVTCANSAKSASGLPIRILTNKYNATNLAGIPVSDYYEVMEVVLNPDHQVSENLRNQAILKVDFDLDEDSNVKWVGWVENPVDVGAECVATYWSKTTYKQWYMNARVVACPAPTDVWQVCADVYTPTSSKACMGGEDGTTLVCDGRIAGILSATTAAQCDVMTAKPFNELSADKPFLYNTVNAAPLVHFSATAFLAMVLVMIRNYC